MEADAKVTADNIFHEIESGPGVKYPVIGLGCVYQTEHQQACAQIRCTYPPKEESLAKPNHDNIILTYFTLYSKKRVRRFFQENYLKVHIVPARQPHIHPNAPDNSLAFEFESTDERRRHFCLENGSRNCKQTKASNLSLFAE